MTTHYRRQHTTPLDRINRSITATRAFRITLGIRAAEFLTDLAYTLVAIGLTAGYIYGLWLLIESLSK